LKHKTLSSACRIESGFWRILCQSRKTSESQPPNNFSWGQDLSLWIDLRCSRLGFKKPPNFIIYLKLFIIFICSKMGQIGKELEFKSLLWKFICFVHRFSTKAVEKIGMNFCLQNLRSTESFPMALSQSQKDLGGSGFLLVFNKSGWTSSSSSPGGGDGKVLTNLSWGPIRNGVIRMIDFGWDNVYHFR
jgi:hypothetical protein